MDWGSVFSTLPFEEHKKENDKEAEEKKKKIEEDMAKSR